MNTNSIGLSIEKSKMLADKLNDLLSHYQIFYMNVRGFHWNVRGEKFFELHAKFEELYTETLVKIDELAERILTVGHTPLHSFSDYIKTSTITEAKHVTEGIMGVELVLSGFKTLIIKQREILRFAADAGDEGTSALMSDYIREQEKLVWMYSSFLNNKS